MENSVTHGEITTVYTGVQGKSQHGVRVAFFITTATLGSTGYAIVTHRHDTHMPEYLAMSSTAPVEAEFRLLAERWRLERLQSPTSDLRQILTLPSYLQIIALGTAAVPSILAEFQARPHHWWLALESITRENPVPATFKGNLDAMREAWLNWGRARGYLA